MSQLLNNKVTKLYENCNIWTKLYLKIRLVLTPFEKVAEYVPKEGAVYDLGCGYGILSNLMALQSPKRKVVGVDLSKKRIAAASKTIGRRKNIQFVHSDLKEIDLEKCSTIAIYDVLHHMDYKAQEALIQECFNKLGENGLLVIKDNDTLPRWKFFWNYVHEIFTILFLITKSDKPSFRTKKNFIEMLFKTGFIVEAVNIPTSLPYPFILYLCRKARKEKLDKGVVFINPPLSMKERYGAIAKGGRNAPPLGLCSLASVVREKGYKTDIIDAAVLNYGLSDVVKKIVNLSPKYIGITASTVAIDRAGKLAARLKKAKKDLIIIIGGPHVTALPKETLLDYPAFDFGVIGEGEKVLVELLSTLESDRNPGLIRGVVFRQGKKVVVTKRRAFIKNLNTLPIPAWDLLPSLKRYYRSSAQSFNRLPSTSLVTSRGCPYQCTFCDRSVFGNNLRSYSPDHVLKMLKILSHQYGIKHILIDDDTFTISKQRLKEICKLMIKERLDLTWTCLARVDTVDKPMLKLMKKAGCWQILYGIESGNQEILNKLRKGITIEQIEKALEITHGVGIRTKGFFILGTPFETKETIRKTIDFIKRIKLDDFHMTYFTPFPGTAIYDNQIENKKFYKKRWSKMNEWTPIFVPKEFSYNDLVAYSKKAFREFYFRPRIVVSYLKTAVSTKNFSPLFYGFVALLRYFFSEGFGERRRSKK